MQERYVTPSASFRVSISANFRNRAMNCIVHLLVPCNGGPGPENATQFLPIPESVTTVKTASDHFKFLVGFSGGVILRTHAISSEDRWEIGSGSGKNDIRVLLMSWKVSNEKVPAHPTH